MSEFTIKIKNIAVEISILLHKLKPKKKESRQLIFNRIFCKLKEIIMEPNDDV